MSDVPFVHTGEDVAKFLRSLFLAAIAGLFLSPAISDVQAPHVSVGSINDLAVPARSFDDEVDVNTAMDSARARAVREHKLALISLGGNSCADCRMLSAVVALPEVQAFTDAHYEAVIVDVGRFNRNLLIPAHFGITHKLEGVPSISIARSDVRLVDEGHTEVLADARSMTAQAIADWLASWAD